MIPLPDPILARRPLEDCEKEHNDDSTLPGIVFCNTLHAEINESIPARAKVSTQDVKVTPTLGSGRGWQ